MSVIYSTLRAAQKMAESLEAASVLKISRKIYHKSLFSLQVSYVQTILSIEDYVQREFAVSKTA